MELRQQRRIYKLQTIEKLIAYPSVRYRIRNFPNRGAYNRRGRLALCVSSSQVIFSHDAFVVAKNLRDEIRRVPFHSAGAETEFHL